MANKPKRQVVSVNFTSQGLLAFADKRAAAHDSGMSGYIRDLIMQDQIEWMDRQKLRDATLRKLTKEERVALGFPPNMI